MTALGRRVLVGAAILGFVLLCALVWSGRFILNNTETALQRAEAFRHRRMRVAQQGEEGAYRFAYVTNRQPGTDQSTLEGRFGNERNTALSFGYFDTEIEPTLGLGMMINPNEWFQNREIQLVGVNPLDEEVFLSRFREIVQASPARSLLVTVHGLDERFHTALRRTAFLGYILDIDTPVLLFDWPSDQGRLVSGYRRAREMAEASGADLARTLELVVREIRPTRLWLVANSLGAEVVVHALSALFRQADMADADLEFEDVVLTAPDVDHEEFNRQFKHEISALARHLTVYVSSNDRALVLSRLVNRSARAGESTLTPDQLDEAATLTELIEPGEDLITLVDVTPINRSRNFHNFSLEAREFFDDLYLRLVYPGRPESRLLYQTRAPDGTDYWVLTRGR